MVRRTVTSSAICAALSVAVAGVSGAEARAMGAAPVPVTGSPFAFSPQIQDAIKARMGDAAREQSDHRRWLRSQQASHQRAQSRTRFGDLSAGQALAEVRARLPGAAMGGGKSPAELAGSGEVAFVSSDLMVVKSDDPTRSRANGSEECAPARATVLVRSSAATVYTFGRVDSGGNLLGCVTGSRRERDLLLRNDAWYPPLAIAGSLAAFVVARGFDMESVIEIPLVDVRRRSPAKRPLLTIGSKGPVGSLVITRRGGIAFISCSFDAPALFAPAGRLVPQCLRPGTLPSVVLKRDSTEPPSAVPFNQLKQLDSSRRIDPASLTLRGHRLRWISAGRAHTSSLR